MNLLSVATGNLYGIADLFLYLSAYYVVNTQPTMNDTLIQAVVIGAELYLEPTSWIFNTCTILTTYKCFNVKIISLAVSWSTLSLLLYKSTELHIHDYIHHFTYKHQPDSVGIKRFIPDGLCGPVMYGLVALTIYVLFDLVTRSYAVINLSAQSNYEKFQRRKFRVRMLTICTAFVISVFLKQQPVITDLANVQFMFVLCTFRLNRKYLDPTVGFAIMVLSMILSTSFIWISKAEEISGNPEKVHQAIALGYNAIYVLILYTLYDSYHCKIAK